MKIFKALQGETEYYFYVLEGVFLINSLIDDSSKLKEFKRFPDIVDVI
jgi:hypothetical protein